MRAVSLFSGVGGFELGFERAGIETVLQAENDPHCLSVLERHWPQTERVSDVRGVVSERESASGNEADEHRSTTDIGGRQTGAGLRSGADLVYGGFPCQDLSVAGKRAGLGGARSNLWFEFERVLSELRPRWTVIENVPGLLSSNGGADFAIILDALDELGFDAAWAVLDAQHFGVPQRRRRVFIVGGPRGRGAEQVLSLCESCGGNPKTGKAPGEGLAGSLGGGSGARGWPDDTDRMTFIASPITASAGHHGYSSPCGDGADNLVAHSLNARDAGVRRLTPRECERLQGWPDDHTRWTADGREISDSHRYRMVGNGVASPVAEWIGHWLVAVDAMLQRGER
tara:strand:+ start:1364 stop:2389 length:1026 start_codon:yes stop_codon:yes gene_type:complete